MREQIREERRAKRLGRRERRREATRDEIKAVAWEQITELGAGVFSLRDVARRMDITAPALYRYFKSRDELITALVVDAFNSFADALEAARDACAPEDHTGRFRAISMAYREWAITYPDRYMLIFGAPIAVNCDPLETKDAGQRSFIVLLSVVAEAYKAGKIHLPPDYAALTPELMNHYEALRKNTGLPFEPIIAHLALVCWCTIHGKVSLEIFGMLPPLFGGSAKIFTQFEVDTYIKQIGLLKE